MLARWWSWGDLLARVVVGEEVVEEEKRGCGQRGQKGHQDDRGVTQVTRVVSRFTYHGACNRLRLNVAHWKQFRGWKREYQ